MQNKSLNEFIDQLKKLINASEFESCIDLLSDAIDQYPSELNLKVNLGNVYKMIGDSSKAKRIYTSLLSTPYKTIAQNNLSLLMLEEGKIDESIKFAKDAIEGDHNYADAKFNLSLGLFENKKYLESLEICNELQSDLTYKEKAYELKIRINQIICSWDSFNKTHEVLKNNKLIVHPFLHVSHVIDEESNYLNARQWNGNQNQIKKTKPKKNISKTLRLGFLCGEIRNHPTFYLIKNLFSNMGNSGLCIYMFSYNHNDEEKDYIKKNFDEFIDITNLNYVDGHKKIKSYELDILIDLTTIISHNRIQMLDSSIAKIIIAYLAFPGTTGNRIYDYILTDKIVTPQNIQKYYDERFLYLPNGYQSNNGKLNIETNTKRESYNLPYDRTILGCLNQSFKLEPVFFNIWIDIMQEHENTCLWLLDEGSEMKNNILNFIENRIDSNRIIFAEKVPYDEHLERIQHIDIALDTRIYNGHTTTIEMIQAGIPLVTLKGNHFASRVSASIINVLGMNELVTNSHNEYKDKIVSLINKDYRIIIKNEIFKKLKNSKLLDINYFSYNFIKKIKGIFT